MKEYIVVWKSNPVKYLYYVNAPSRRIACWCALNMYIQDEYCSPIPKVNDFKAYPANWKATNDIDV